MKSRKRFIFIVSLATTIGFAQNVMAIPVGGTLRDSHSATFDTGFGVAVVDSKVYEYVSGEFVYTYQIDNQDSAIGFSFFSVGIPDGANAQSPSVDSDPISGWVDPVFCTVAGSPVQSVDYLFADTVDSGERSSVLWFVSDHTYGLGKSTLFGKNVCTMEDLLTPIPEPATIALFGIGGLIINLTRKRRF